MNRRQRRAKTAADRRAEAGYRACAERMHAEALAFLRARPGFTPRFNGFPPYIMAKVPAGVPEHEVALAAAIPDVLPWWPADAETRELLERMDTAGEREGTYMQAKVGIELALEKRAQETGGSA